MDSEKLVSIIIPAYNVENYLRKCLETVGNQTYRNLEIVLVDDGSGDATPQICDNAAKDDIRIRVIHKDNEGLSAARNDGIGVSTGEYICFLDADDGIHPRFVEKLVYALETHKCDIAQCDYYAVRELDISFFDMDNTLSEVISGDEAIVRCYDQDYSTYNSVWTKIYRREIFEKIRFPVGKLREDEHTTWKLLKEADNIVYLHEYLYLYLIRDDSIMGARSLKLFQDGAEAFWERALFFCESKRNYAAVRACLHVIAQADKAERYYEYDDIDSIGLIEMRDKARQLIERLYYGYEFPYSRIKRNSVIAIYGGGQKGKAYYSQLQDTEYAKEVIWVDTYALRENNKVVSIDNLFRKRVDYVVIAVKSKSVALGIIDSLISMGIEKNKIIFT